MMIARSKLLLAIPLSIFINSATQAALINIDFEKNGYGFDLSEGTKITNQFDPLGFSVSAIGGSNDAMIFDSSDPTGGDKDLGTPNEACGGPGVGVGGKPGTAGENCNALGNILIISEDGDSSDPDDNARGGILRFDFSTAVIMNSIGILDIDNGEGEEIRLFNSKNLLVATFDFNQYGDNSFQNIDLEDYTDITRMDVFFTSSGAITDFTYTTVPEPALIALMGAGLLGIGLARRRTKRN